MQEFKEATVLRAEFKKSFNSKKGGQMFVFNLQFDNGDRGEYVSKNNPQDKFIANQRAKYVLEERTDFPDIIKPYNEPQAGGGYRGGGGGGRESAEERESKNRQIVAQSSVKAAVELATHQAITVQSLPVMAKKIFDLTYDISGGMDSQAIKEKYLNK